MTTGPSPSEAVPVLYVCHGDDTKVPALRLADGAVLTHSRAILGWIAKQA